MFFFLSSIEPKLEFIIVPKHIELYFCILFRYPSIIDYTSPKASLLKMIPKFVYLSLILPFFWEQKHAFYKH